MQYRRPACAVHADRAQAKRATVITCKRKSILCYEANVALKKEAFKHVIKKHPLRIRAFVLFPDHIHGIWTFDVSRQLELMNYGYKFLRINEFALRPNVLGQTKTDVLNYLLENSFES